MKAAGGDSAGAVALIDRATMAFYDDLRRDALTVTADELKRRSLDDQIAIIMFRQGKRARELRDTPIATLVAASLTTIVDPDQLKLGAITLDGDHASAQPIVGEIEVPFNFDFRRDPEGWRLNFIAATKKVTAMIRDGQPDDEVIAWLAGYYKVDVDALYAPPQ